MNNTEYSLSDLVVGFIIVLFKIAFYILATTYMVFHW